MIYIFDKLKIISLEENFTIECQIVTPSKEMVPRKKDGWSFNWMQAYREKPKSIFVLNEISSEKVHGIIQLVIDEGMLIMELLELAPFNIGSQKEYENVAGCLIAFGCRESFKLNNAYKGYLTFFSKSSLVELYKTKYYASQTIGARMYIDPMSGIKLINKYLY